MPAPSAIVAVGSMARYARAKAVASGITPAEPSIRIVAVEDGAGDVAGSPEGGALAHAKSPQVTNSRIMVCMFSRYVTVRRGVEVRKQRRATKGTGSGHHASFDIGLDLSNADVGKPDRSGRRGS